MRTLLISDLHLGGRLGHCVLTRPRPLDRLLAQVESADRLVLLGDVVELMQGRQQRAMTVAEPIMRALGRLLGPEREVVIVPGNHDIPLVRPWLRANGQELAVETELPVSATPVLAQLSHWLGPARVRVSYPGFRVSERVWATHGHYLDHHLIPRSAYGLTRGLLGRRRPATTSPLRYELSRRPSLSRAAPWLPAPALGALEAMADFIRASTMPRVRRTLLNRRMAPVTSMLLGLQMQRASIPALTYVVRRLGVQADWVVFGHVHRLGPLPDDDPQQWKEADGPMRLMNTGSWLYEPRLLHRARPPHPYWPGGAVIVKDGGEPQVVGLLDDLGVSDFLG